MDKRVPVTQTLAQRRLGGQISTEAYFAQVYAVELPHAAEQVDRADGRRKTLSASAQTEAIAIPAQPEEIIPLNHQKLGQKIVAIINKFL